MSGVRGNDRYGVDKVSAETEGPQHTTTAADLMKRGFSGFGPAEAPGFSGDGRVGMGMPPGDDSDDEWQDAV